MPYADRSKLTMGLIGLSTHAIQVGKTGVCKFPTGGLNPKTQQPIWETFEVEADEPVRAKRDVIVCDDQGRVKEHTPVELSYQTGAGPYQRVTEAFPLPVTMSSDPTSWANINKTDSSTTILVAGVQGKTIRVHYLIISSNESIVVDVGISFKSNPTLDAEFPIRVYVPADGGTIPLNLTDANIEGAEGETLYAYCAAAYANGIRFNVATKLI